MKPLPESSDSWLILLDASTPLFFELGLLSLQTFFIFVNESMKRMEK